MPGAHRTFGSYIFDRAASQPVSKAGRLASHLRRSIKPRIKQRNLPVRPLADIPWDLGNVAEEIAADVVLVKLCAVHHASGAGNKIQGALQDNADLPKVGKVKCTAAACLTMREADL